MINVLLNKKCLYLGVTLFSAMILTTLPTQNVKAATTSDGSSTVTTAPTSSTTTTQPTTTGTTTQPTTNTTTGTVQPTTSTTPTTGTTSTSGTTATTSTTTTGTASSTTGTTNPTTTTSTAPTTGTSTTTTTQPTTSTTPVTTTTSDTPVTIVDPTLEAMVKNSLGLSSSQAITQGDFQNYGSNGQTEFDLLETEYLDQTNPSITDQQDTPIESLSGLQALTYIPKDIPINVQLKLASDAQSNPDLTPLDNVPIHSLTLDGNFSDPSAKEISTSQLTNLDVSSAYNVELTGDSSLPTNAGITQSELNQIAPWLVSFANNGGSYNVIALNNGSISDLSPLSGINRDRYVAVMFNNNRVTSTSPVYATTDDPAGLTFTAEPLKGLDGEDLSSQYHFTSTVDSPVDDDLTHVSGSTYNIANPNEAATTLTYGVIGNANSTNTDSMIVKNYGNSTLSFGGTTSQPLIWRTATATPATSTTDQNVSGGTTTTTATVNIKPIVPTVTTVQVQQGIVRTHDQVTQLVNSLGQRIPAELAPNTAWYYNKIVAINGQNYYQVATDEYLPVSNSFVFTPETSKTVIDTSSVTPIYNSEGQRVDASLSAHTNWLTDGVSTINGTKMYRVATDEWVPVNSVSLESTYPTVYKTISQTALYSATGKLLPYSLKAGTAWKVDEKVVIGGVTYYRVATDEFVKA